LKLNAELKQGKSIQASLRHIVFLPSSVEGKFPTVIALHGRGADENDLVPLVMALGVSEIVVVTPRAPFAFPFGGYAWYNVVQEGIFDPETFETSRGLLRKFVNEVKARYPVDPSRIILLGFSQGTVMSYAIALSSPSEFRGLAALSGYVPTSSDLHLPTTRLAGFPVFISHGTNDPLIPVQMGRGAAETLRTAGADVTYHEYAMGHQVTEEGLQDLREWARKLLAT
jgi:phospholipase/carboxylesterase